MSDLERPGAAWPPPPAPADLPGGSSRTVRRLIVVAVEYAAGTELLASGEFDVVP